MLIELIWGVLASILSFIIGLFPDLPSAEWLRTGVASGVSTISAGAGTLSAWVPFGTAATCLTFLIGTLGVVVLVKVVRIIASFFTAGGGSAA